MKSTPSDAPVACPAQEAGVWRDRIERWSRITPVSVEARILLCAAIAYALHVESRLLQDAEAGQ